MKKRETTTINNHQENITSLESFISRLKKIIEDTDLEKYEIYFRGHANCDYLLIPSLLRNGKQEGQALKNIVDNEHIAFRSIVAKQPAEFMQCGSTIEHLVKMQHYGLHTRLLDITSNALIALYFACVSSTEEMDKMGQVIIFKLPKYIIKHYDSDTISAVANIAKCEPRHLDVTLCGYSKDPNDFIEGLLIIDNNTRYTVYSGCPQANTTAYKVPTTKTTWIKKSPSSTTKYRNNRYNITSSIPGELFKKYHTTIEECRDRIQKLDTSDFSYVSSEYLLEFNQQIYYLHREIKAEKLYIDEIEPFDLGKIWVVKTKLDNKRIANQNGAFLLFGLGMGEFESYLDMKRLKYSKELYPKIPNNWIAGRINISYKHKKQIIKDLSMCGINHAYIFPELETAAEEINKQLLS